MNLHANAALSLNKRRDLCRRVVDDRWALKRAAQAAEVSERCARKWVGRYRVDGELGLLDRSSAPLSIPHRTSEERVQAIAALRRLRFTGPEIAETLGMALSTVSGILTRIGMGKLGRLGLAPAVRYERERPGELIHIDVKKLGCIQGGAGKRVTGKPRHNWERSDRSGTRRKLVGWEYVHIAIDASISPSMTTRAWPTQRFSQTRRRAPRSVPAPCKSLLSAPRDRDRAAHHG